jgi:uncharacterized membrane protein YhaH (DUF805 family)
VKNLLWYLSFEGRCNRLTFWLSQLGIWPVLFVAVVIVSIVFGRMPNETGLARLEEVHIVGQVFVGVVVAVLFWFQICIEVKRWHDRGKSGWWYWIGLVPVIGGLWVLIECGFRRGTEGANLYGPRTDSNELLRD